MSKPIIEIKDFVGMSDNGGIFYNEGFLPQKINGKSVFEETFKCFSVAERTTTGFSLLATVSGMNPYYYTSTYSGLFSIDSSGQIFINSLLNYSGKVHGVPTSGAVAPSSYGDILQTVSGNVIYTSANHLGIGYIGVVKTGSSTTQIIDTDGRSFATLGAVVGEATHNKITNLRTGVEYTIATIANGDATNDKVTFTASGTNDNVAGDYFIVWIDDKAWTTAATLFTTTSYPQFVGQETAANFRRQLKQYGDVYYALNGNFLAQLSSDETTVDDNYKQLPARMQARSFGVNRNNLLISAERDTKGVLLLWDGYSDGWNNIIDIDEVCKCVYQYKSGWIVFFNNSFYYTDGYQLEKLSSFYPDDYPSEPSYAVTPYGFSSILAYNDRFFITNSTQNYSRINPGVCIYDQKYGWNLVPIEYASRNQFGTDRFPSALAIGGIGNYLYVGGSYFINRLSNYGNKNNEYQNKSLMFYLYGEENFGIGSVELDISNNLRSYLQGSASFPRKTKITVSIGDVKNGVFQYSQSKDSGNTTTNIDVTGTTYLGATVGDEVQILEGVCAGERTFITAITNQGTATESWTVSPALSAGIGASTIDLKIIKVKHCETKTIDADELSEPIRFDCKGFNASKAIVEIVVHGYYDVSTTPNTYSFPISINAIKIYGR
jgi:hypothetical protein